MNPFKTKILRYKSLPSTNNEAARLALLGYDEGLAVVAEEQTAGRGRLQRSWVSPRGAGLYCSVLLRPKFSVDRWPLITFVGALSVSDALMEACDLTTDIKWPNDLLANERKLCGILAEAIETSAGRAVILGIGINLTQNAYPPELANVATSVSEATGQNPDRETILAALLPALSRWYALLNEPEKIVAAWCSRSSYANGKLVQVSNGDEVWQGTTCGVEHDGALRLGTASGEIKLVRAGDVYGVRPSS